MSFLCVYWFVCMVFWVGAEFWILGLGPRAGEGFRRL